jgi:hypothetical protein
MSLLADSKFIRESNLVLNPDVGLFETSRNNGKYSCNEGITEYEFICLRDLL